MSAFDRLESQLLERVAGRSDAAATPQMPEPGRTPDPTPGPRRGQRTRRWVLGGVTVGLAATAVVIAAALPGDASSPTRLLTPEQAVAAASHNLESDGILEWVDVQGDAVQGNKARSAGSQTTGTRIARWVDLKTGDHSEFQTSTFRGARGEPRVMAASIWQVGRTKWLDEGQTSKTNGKRVIRKTVVDRPPIKPEYINTPVMEVRKDLERAAAGKIAVEDAGRIDGIPAVRIVDVRPTFTKRVWISREKSPRVLRSSFTMDCMEKLAGRCRPDMPNTVYAPMTTESRTLTWRIHPRSDASLGKIRPPAFDPAKYTVVTTHRD